MKLKLTSEKLLSLRCEFSGCNETNVVKLFGHHVCGNHWAQWEVECDSPEIRAARFERWITRPRAAEAAP